MTSWWTWSASPLNSMSSASRSAQTSRMGLAVHNGPVMSQIGDVILTARRAAGLTQEELADRLGITQAALSRYENDLRAPDDATVERMSEILGVSTEFLTHPFRLRGAIAADAHMRRQKTTKVTEWKSAESKLNLYRMRSAFLTRRIPMNPSNHMPTFDPDDTTPADAARMVRAQWRMPIGPVRNLTRWIESAGVIVIEEHLGTRRIDGLSQWRVSIQWCCSTRICPPTGSVGRLSTSWATSCCIRIMWTPTSKRRPTISPLNYSCRATSSSPIYTTSHRRGSWR